MAGIWHRPCRRDIRTATGVADIRGAAGLDANVDWLALEELTAAVTILHSHIVRRTSCLLKALGPAA